MIRFRLGCAQDCDVLTPSGTESVGTKEGGGGGRGAGVVQWHGRKVLDDTANGQPDAGDIYAGGRAQRPENGT